MALRTWHGELTAGGRVLLGEPGCGGDEPCGVRAGPEPDLSRERDVRSQEREQERRALGECRALGERHHLCAIDRCELDTVRWFPVARGFEDS